MTDLAVPAPVRLSSPRSRTLRAGLAAAALTLAALAGCSDLNPTQQRALTGTVGGAGAGAIIGAIAGNAGLGAVIGAGAGLAGGLIYDQVKKNEAESYQQGYYAGSHHAKPPPPPPPNNY